MSDNHTRKAVSGLNLRAAVYLVPVPLSDTDAHDVLPSNVLELIPQIRFWVVENIRTARRWLKRFDRTIDIDSLSFVELSEHTDPAEIPAMLAPVTDGHALGVMSEAGCPAVADPGALLVAAAQQRAIPVVPLVGPSSILLALMASGLNGQSFCFNGYLPAQVPELTERVKKLVSEVRRADTTQIFIETPYRNRRLFEHLLKVLPPTMRLCVGVDITGESQSIRTMTVEQWQSAGVQLDKLPTIFLIGS